VAYKGVFMDFALNPDHEDLRASVRGFLEANSSEPEVRRLMATTEGYEPAVWTQMASQLGLQGLIIPEQYGGSGYSYAELVVVFEEMGRALLCAPFFATVALATNTILLSDDDHAKGQYMPGIAAGTTVATLALTEDAGRWDAPGIATTATKTDNGWLLNGHKNFVLDGHVANLMVVAARTDDSVSLFAVTEGAAGLTRTPLSVMDQTRKMARLGFDDTPAQLVGAEGQGWPIVAKALDRAAVALAAEQVGGAQKVLEMSVAYSKVRKQFGKPIGSFQAIKHKCTDMLLEIEAARSAVYYAGAAAAEDTDELPMVAALAQAYCTDAFVDAATENIQIHGGIGFTWEHPAHLYFKRAHSSRPLLGDANYHRELVAQRMGI
jgi:alkylation response protein AidB-like acyl-CoA dehydrogenase